jgi:hypothetical protein
MGISAPRERTFSGLAPQQRLEREKVASRCGIMIIDLRSGDVVHWLRIEGIVNELYDVAILRESATPP